MDRSNAHACRQPYDETSIPRFGGVVARAARVGALSAALVAMPCFAASAGEIVHVVAKGQTLGRIAKRYNTTVAALRDANDLKPGEQIHPGATLVIPDDKDPPARRAGRGATEGRVRSRPVERRGARGGSGALPAASYAAKPKRPGFVRLARGPERVDVQVLTRHDQLVPASLPAVTRILRFYPTDSKTAIDPRLVTLLGMVSNHFGGRTVQVVSGYRPYSPAQYTPHSNHNVGRAIDFRIEGVPNAVVRDYCRNFRNAGVGYYPNSTFVHLDVRSPSAYWIDYSRPGEAPRYDPAHDHLAADESAAEVESGSPMTPYPSEASQNNSQNQEMPDSRKQKLETMGTMPPTIDPQGRRGVR